jgi:hypothetical protein
VQTPDNSQNDEDSQSGHIFTRRGGESPPLLYKEVLDEVFSSQPNLVDTTIPNADLELFTDGRQSPEERKQAHKTGAKENSERWFITLK